MRELCIDVIVGEGSQTTDAFSFPSTRWQSITCDVSEVGML